LVKPLPKGPIIFALGQAVKYSQFFGLKKTGPMGVGPMTGGTKGLCNPATAGTIPAYTGGYDNGKGFSAGYR